MALKSEFVQERLREAAAKFRWSRGARHLIAGTAVSAFFLAVFLLSDTQFHFGSVGRWLGFILTVSPPVVGLAMALPSFFQKVSDASIARRIERASTGQSNVLINAVQFGHELPAGSLMRAALFDEMQDPFPRVRWGEVFNLALLKKLSFALASVAFVLLVWAVIRPAYFANSAARIFLPASSIAPLTRTQIVTVAPGDDEIPHGTEARLNVKLGGRIPSAAWVHFRERGSGWQKVLMDREVGQPDYAFAWQEVRQPIDYYIEAGDARSQSFKIAVRPRIAVRSRSAEIEPPAYTGLGRSVSKDFVMLQNVIPGSRVNVTFEFNGAVGELRAAAEKEGAFSVARIEGARWQIEGKVLTSQTVKLDYRDTRGLADSASLQIVVQPDDAPKISISAPAEGREVVASPDASLPVRFTATDNFALGSVALYNSTNEKQDARLVREWKEAAGQKSFTAEIQIPLGSFVKPGDDRVTFCVIAKDRNDVSGPGVAVSRPIVVTLRSTEKIKQQSQETQDKMRHSLEELIKLQRVNLEETRNAAKTGGAPREVFAPLIERQAKIADTASQIAESAEVLATELRTDLRSMVAKEMKDALIALRNCGNSSGEPRAKFLTMAMGLEAAILARLQGAPVTAEAEAEKGRIEDLIAGLENLLRQQREILRETGAASEQAAKPLSGRQDALADQSVRVRKEIESNARNGAMGDQDFRARLAKVGTMFGEFRIYEEMLAAAEKLQGAKFPDAATTEKKVVVNLAKMIEFLNQWQFARAAEEADVLKKETAEMKEKLDRLAEIQREVVEKSKELAHKDEFRPEDQSTAKEIQKTKDLMAEVIEQMLTDAHAFPDLKPSNELRSELTQIYEDVMQTDKQEVADGKLKPQEIAVQKEDGILKGIEEAKKIAEDMEMWLPTNNETQKWQLENFDKTEMPEIPNLPLPDAFEDIVGNLLDEQKDLAQEVQDAASNQAFAMNPANGWEIRDGPMPGFGAQGKSGNERPNKNEQTGRSSGGREGMSDGEMVGDRASNLEGTKPDVRRTNDPMQQGQVKDDGGIGQTRATGGGKAGGFSDRNGMDGNAPLRATNAPEMAASDALAVKQALLAEKTSKKYAQASLLYLRAGGLTDVSRWMEESKAALQQGRVKDFENLHRKIVGRLNEVKGGIPSGGTLSLPARDGAGVKDKQLLGGDEGEVPDAYKKPVADYYRSLSEEK